MYGGARITMPFLEALARRSLVARNFFPQACCTGAGLTSLATGRLPIDHGIFYPPHQLAVDGQYLSLATLLRARGYRTLQLSEDRYSDANALLLRGFERVNGWMDERVRRLPAWTEPHQWVLKQLSSRLGADVEEIPIGEATSGNAGVRRKFDLLVEELRWTERPVFAQVHLLESHGPRFSPKQRRFSVGQEQTSEWMDDFYDDVLLDLDRELSKLFESIGELGLTNKVIVVVTSDHAQRWDATARIPLLMFGPGIRPGVILENTQPIDVPASIVNVLGIRQPFWMLGSSLVGVRKPDPWRPVIATSIGGHAPVGLDGRWEILPTTLNRGLTSLGVTVCDRQFSLDLTTGEMVETKLTGTLAECPKRTQPTADAMKRRLVEYLRQYGYSPVETKTPATN